MDTRKPLRALLVMGILGFSLAQIVPAQASVVGDEGCTPGFWKTHTDVWEEYTPDMVLDQLFAFPPELADFEDVTLLAALAGGGGPGLDGAATILMRAAVAAYLNAAHDGLGYPLQRDSDTAAGQAIHTQVNTALASLDRDAMLSVASFLDGLNNLGSDFC